MLQLSNGRPLDITYLIAPARVGGLETVTATLAAGFARRGHRVRLLTLLGSGSEERCLSFVRLEGTSVDVREIRLPPRRYRTERRWVMSQLDASPETVLHCHGFHADLIGWLAGRAARCPVVSTAHGFDARTHKGRLYEWFDRRVLGRIDAVVVVSRPLRDLLIRDGVPRENVHLIANAWSAEELLFGRIEARLRLGLPEIGQVVGWVGRLTSEKGPDVFLKAVAELPEGIVASVIGAGPMRDSLVREAERLGRMVYWHGEVSNASRLLLAYDALVLSSWTEGTPMVLLEAMAAGVPVVTTTVGGVPDVVSDHEAILAPAGDATGLAKGVRRCLDEPVQTSARVREAKDRLLRDYDREEWLDQYEAVYRNVRCC